MAIGFSSDPIIVYHLRMKIRSNTQKIPPHLCYTVSGCLIIKHRILLVKHRKAGFWLKPGGHMEPGELPHKAAEREFFEETGIAVKAAQYGFFPNLKNQEKCQFIPVPFACNLHWVSHENYQKRIQSVDPHKLTQSGVWQRGCEQHCHFDFLLEPVSNSLVHKLDPEESLDIGWFSLEEIKDLDTTEDIKSEIEYAFTLLEKQLRKRSKEYGI